MTNSIVIKDKSRTIEITKKFAAAAKNFGSQEYEDLQRARSHYPNYYVKVRSAARKADHFKGLTFDYMEKYIKKHNMELLKTFYVLCGKTEEGKKQDFAAAATYGEIKKWFIEQFPELEIKRKTIDEILGNTAA